MAISDLDLLHFRILFVIEIGYPAILRSYPCIRSDIAICITDTYISGWLRATRSALEPYVSSDFPYVKWSCLRINKQAFLRLGPYGGPMGGAVSYERGTTLRQFRCLKNWRVPTKLRRFLGFYRYALQKKRTTEGSDY